MSSAEPRRDRPSDSDPYTAVIRSLSAGVLITVNNSGSATASGSGELRVLKQTSEGEVLLNGHGSQQFILRPETDDGPILERINDGMGSGVRSVETIEVIGVAE